MGYSQNFDKHYEKYEDLILGSIGETLRRKMLVGKSLAIRQIPKIYPIKFCTMWYPSKV